MAKLATYPGEWTVIGRYVENEDWGHEDKGTRGKRGWKHSNHEGVTYNPDIKQFFISPHHAAMRVRDIDFGTRQPRAKLFGACLHATGQSEQTECPEYIATDDDPNYEDVTDVVVFLAHMPKLWAYRWIVQFIENFPNERSGTPIRWMKVYPPHLNVPQQPRFPEHSSGAYNRKPELKWQIIEEECSDYLAIARKHKKLLFTPFAARWRLFQYKMNSSVWTAGNLETAKVMQKLAGMRCCVFALILRNGSSFMWRRNATTAPKMLVSEDDYNQHYFDPKTLSHWSNDVISGDLEGWICSGNDGICLPANFWGARIQGEGRNGWLEERLGFKIKRSHMTKSWLDYY